MAYTGHKNRRMPSGETIVDWIKPTVKDEARFYGIEMPSDEQIAIVLRSARMHHLMEHAAGYDNSELGSPEEVTKYWPIESSIGRFLRDAPLELLDQINIGDRQERVEPLPPKQPTLVEVKIALALIANHYGKDEEAFKEQALKLAEQLQYTANGELTMYIYAQMGLTNTWVPQ